MKKKILLLVQIITAIQLAGAQNAYRGTVADATTGEMIELATVQLVRGASGRLIEYTTTDAEGRFSLTTREKTDSLYIFVSTLGYKPYKEPAEEGKFMKIQLETQAINLREVVVRPGRVWTRKDTINYSIADFLNSKDENIKDVIKKLPGIDIDKSGKISYNGKDISHFYVEGMDLTDGKYNRINNNLKAQAVETVQVLENHQAVRMLKDKINSEDVAINLKLKPEFRQKWMVNLQTALGYSPAQPTGKILWNNDLNALQLSKASQSIYTYKGNNTGNDSMDENQQLTTTNPTDTQQSNITHLIQQPSFIAPLNKERLLFNETHTASGNRLHKINEKTLVRINGGYTNDIRRQQRGSHTTYFQAQDTISLAESSKTSIHTHKAEMSINIENNSENHFLTNKLQTTGLWQKGNSSFGGNQSLQQKISTDQINFRNDLQNLQNKEHYTQEIRSTVQYSHQPSRLEVDNTLREKINFDYFYTNNSYAWIKKKGELMQRYSAGFTTQISNLQNGYSAYITPMWQLNKSKWITTITTPTALTCFTGQNFLKPSINPSLSVRYKYNYAWMFSLFANYKEIYGPITDYYASPYYTDYRNQVQNNGILSIRRNQIYSLYGEYKNIINEFFATLSLTHNRGWSNRIFEQLIQDNATMQQKDIVMVAHKQSTQLSGFTISGRLSKGFFDYNLKLSINCTLGTSEAEQLSLGERVPYKSKFMFYEPKINWNPFPQFDVNYEGLLRYSTTKIGDNTQLSPILNVVQKINLSYDFSFIEFGLSADHYYNDVDENTGTHAFLVDASLQWSSNSWKINLNANNLLNKKQYGYTQYTSLQSYTSWINIRGRELLCKVSYRF